MNCGFRLQNLRLACAIDLVMDFPWPTPSDTAHCDKDLNLLDGDNLLLELDDKTLQVRFEMAVAGAVITLLGGLNASMPVISYSAIDNALI